ncbi:leucine-rich repeat flightless-interacting protein 1-like isoform X6 [Salvelinus fontinalis]|uniref:leucine-rich repeat flightless-interacting protein 1-like isoform X6 n=1 Tax=Salvelinus fontinalis TaxID=8038 RepID=UPI002486B80A|nr:leucine-rich repeat flightless-interacting protein 1-like isoform X6 [Salvelinus fontinalis]
MGTQGTGRKRNPNKDRSTAEDDALNLISREAEARLAAKRAARAEAREIRMKELERQQKELEDRDYLEKGSRAASTLSAATLASLGGSSSQRESGETSITGDTETSIREIKDTLVEVEEKYRKAMVSNAQLDNEKNNLMYQVDTLKDSLMELEELLSESRREYEGKSKDFEREKHAHGVLQFQFNEMKETLKQSEELLTKHGVVLRPDLTANGETLELGTEGSASGEPGSQLALDSQTSPMEGGNSMLGRAQETALESRGDKVVDPGRSRQQEDTHEEEARENHLTSPTPCSLVGVSETETPREAQPFSPTLREEVEIEGSDVNKDSDNTPVVEVKSGPVCDAEVLVVVTGPEEEVTVAGEGYEAAGVEGTGQGRVEVASEGELGIENDEADEAETKVVKSSDNTKETSSKEPTSEYGAAAEQEKNESSKEDVNCLDSYPLPRGTIEDTMKNGTQISQGTDLDTSKSPIKSNLEPQKTKKSEVLPEITDLQPQAQAGNKKKKGKKKKGETQSDVKQEDHKKSTTETCVVSMTNGTQISLGTDLDTPKSPVESNPEPQQPEPRKTKKACVLPETTDMQPQSQGGKKKKKGKKKGEKQGDETQGDEMSKTEKDMVSTPTDKEPVEAVGEGVITIETQQHLEEGTSSSPDRELQTIAEEGLNLKEEQLEEDRVEVKSEGPTIEVSLTDQAKSEEVVSKKKKKKMKKDKHKPTMESAKSEGEISVLSLESNIGIADPVAHSKCITSAHNPMEELESTANTGTQKDESGYTTNPDNVGDCLNSSADPKCPLDSKQSTAGNSNNVKEEGAITVSVEEAQTIQDTKEQGNNFHSPIVLRPELKKSVEPEDLFSHDGVTTHPDQANENATQDLKEAGQDKQNGSPEERTNALEHEDTSMALPANVEKCNNSADEKCCSISLDRNCPAAETIRLPEQLVDILDCPVTDRHLYDNNKPETASNGGISTETELNATETRLQDPLKETPVTIDSFREQSHNESGPCTMVAKAEEQDDPIEAKLEGNEVPGPSEQWNDEENENEGQSFDFSDLVSVIPANVFPITSQEEVSQEMRTMSVGYKMEVEPGKEEANEEEEDDKPQDTEGVSAIVAQQSIEGGSDNAPEELRRPEEKAQTIVESQNVNEEQQLITLEEGVSVTYNQKDIAEEGVSVTVEHQGVEESERQQNVPAVEALPVEEGEEAIQYGSQQGRRESSRSTEDSAEGDNEQSRTGLKKGSKKVKGKGKEDCRMS